MVFILDIKKAGIDFKEKGIIGTGLDINSKVNIYLCRLKCSLYNILTLNKVLRYDDIKKGHFRLIPTMG